MTGVICSESNLILLQATISTKYPAAIPGGHPKTQSPARDMEVLVDEGSRISCSRCDVPLTGHEQFLGHMALSHEVTATEAEKQWVRLTRRITSHVLVGEGSY
jgi:hypothetical protein